MRRKHIIGNKKYKFKKDIIAYYRSILNSYNFGESLNKSDFNDMIDLLNYDIQSDTNEEVSDNPYNNLYRNEENTLYIKDIKVSKVQFGTKCFEVFYYDDTSVYISYLMIINSTKYTPEKLFNEACRNSIHSGIRSVKQEYFNKHSEKGRVKCQETNKPSIWTELVVDHRQPNTFSVIVDRFKELNNIDLEKIKYTTNEDNILVFENDSLSEEFQKYHMEKANLRIVRRECNSSRTGQARIKRTSKDLRIK